MDELAAVSGQSEQTISGCRRHMWRRRERQRFGSTVVPPLKINTFRFTGVSDH